MASTDPAEPTINRSRFPKQKVEEAMVRHGDSGVVQTKGGFHEASSLLGGHEP